LPSNCVSGWGGWEEGRRDEDGWMMSWWSPAWMDDVRKSIGVKVRRMEGCVNGWIKEALALEVFLALEANFTLEAAFTLEADFTLEEYFALEILRYILHHHARGCYQTSKLLEQIVAINSCQMLEDLPMADRLIVIFITIYPAPSQSMSTFSGSKSPMKDDIFK
jgi:hypothetical protein